MLPVSPVVHTEVTVHNLPEWFDYLSQAGFEPGSVQCL